VWSGPISVPPNKRFLTVAAFNIIGDRFRDALDPRSD